MKHTRTIIELIEIDLINFKLVKGLDNLGLDSSIYMKDTCRLIFKLMGIKKKFRTDDLYKEYFGLIRKEIDIQNKQKLKKFSINIYENILKHKRYKGS